LFASAPAPCDTFAANRAFGRIGLAVEAGSGRSRRQRVHEAGSLRVRFPHVRPGGALEAIIVNTAGGMAGGDRFEIDVKVDVNARLTLMTTAAEKVYRSLGPDTQFAIRLAVDAGGDLAWLPQETIVFNNARLRREIDVDLADGANLLIAEAAVFGRAAMGERVHEGLFFDRWRIRVDGSLRFAETVRLDGAIAQKLAARAVARAGIAIATIVKIPGNDANVAAVRGIEREFAGEVGISAWNGIAVARLVANDGAALRRDLIAVLTALGGKPLPRLWLN
jgi:urease accessory protein